MAGSRWSVGNRGEETVDRTRLLRRAEGYRPPQGQLLRTLYGGYNIALDREGYPWAMVCGPSRDDLWILKREPKISAELCSRLVGQARELGFPVDALIRVSQEEPPAPGGS